METPLHLSIAVAAVAMTLLAGATHAQEHPISPVRNLDEMKFAATPRMPGCASSALQSGDPATGPSIFLAKLATDCTVPWHWHSPNERLMMVSGGARIEMKDGQTLMLRAGGFAEMPSRHVHRFTCVSECALYVASDAAFDIHYVDAAGREITPQEALAAQASPAQAEKR